jgi:hypothetical protein
MEKANVAPGPSWSIMTLTPYRIIGGEIGVKARLPMLAPPLAALAYPFALKGFNASVTRIAESGRARFHG